MNKSRLNQIMQILLMPYQDKSLIDADKDYLNNLRYYYFMIRNMDSSQTRRKRDLEERYHSALKELEVFLKQHSRMKIRSLDDAKQLINLFFSEPEIVNLIGKYDGNCQKEAINWWYVNNIFRIAESLLTFRDGKIAIRTWVNDEKQNGQRDIFDYHDSLNKAEIWNILSRMVVPDLFVAAFHVECRLTDKKYVYHQLGNVSLADKELDIILQKGCAETHMHFNAGISHVTLWKKFTNPFVWRDGVRNKRKSVELLGEDERWILHLIIYRILMAEFLQCEGAESFCKYIEATYNNVFHEIVSVMHEFKMGQSLDAIRVEKLFLTLCSEWSAVYKNSDTESDFLFHNIYKYDVLFETTAEIFFQVQVLEYIKKHEKDTHCMHLFMQYIRLKNIFFSERIQAGGVEGFKSFQHYYSKSTRLDGFDRKNYCKRIRAVFENQIQNSNLKKLEIRITPNVRESIKHNSEPNQLLEKEMEYDILSAVKDILQEYLSCIKDYLGQSINEESLEKLDGRKEIVIPQIGIVFHFIKRDHLDNRLGNMCWLRQVKEQPYYNKHILAYRESLVQTAEVIERLRSKIPLLNEYIVGIDVASEEVSTEPWIMAPVYRAVRNREITKPIVHMEDGSFKHVQNLGFTYHVGEEFRHVLSGLRYIDEVIERFGYKAADRIGHAIALGIDIDYWIDKNEVVVIPINEYLENLVWLWGNIVYKDMRLPVSVEVIEGKILELAQKIYQDISGMTVFMLYQAYKEKFKRDHRKTFERMEKAMQRCEEEGEHFCSNYASRDNHISTFWTKDKIVCTYFCPVHWQKFREPILISVKKDEADLYKFVQDQIRRKIEKLGVYVETNPTSNSTIGEIAGILNHPILNLNAKGLQSTEAKSVLVTINSDNPIIFNTNSENEIAYIYYMLLHQGYDKEHVLQWVDKVRQYGMDSSFIKEEKRPSKHVKEMMELIEIIDSYMR